MTHPRGLVLLDAPSNLGLRPLVEGVMPGCYKLPWALRDLRLLERLGAHEGGAVVPPAYDARWQPGDGSRNAAGIAGYSLRLADRVGMLLAEHRFPIVLGGDCSILIGNAVALHRRGRYGLVFLDAHSDFRHQENFPPLVAAAGEDLAIMTRRGDPRLVDLEGRGPYFRSGDIHVAGIRPGDPALHELRADGITVTTSAEVSAATPEQVAGQIARTVTRHTEGFWIHLDADVVDGAEMPAVDSPEPDGISFAVLAQLLGWLLRSPRCVGMEVTILDPDRDPDGACARGLADCLVNAFAAALPY